QQSPLFLLQVGRVGLFGAGGQIDQATVAAEGPAVEGALEGQAVALVVAADHVAPVRAGVEKYVDLAVAAASDDDLLLAHARPDEIAGVRDLAFVPDEEPVASEDLVELLLINVRVAENGSADPTFFVVHQPLHVEVAACHQSVLSVSQPEENLPAPFL